MPQIQIEEVFTGGSLTTIIDTSDLDDLRRALLQRGANQLELHRSACGRSTVYHTAEIETLTDAHYQWLTQRAVGELRWIVVADREPRP